MTSNPFTPSFGQIPPTLAGRDKLIADVLSGLDGLPGNPNRATIFIGARGTGKTVLLATIAQLAEERGWISVNVTANESMLDEILVQAQQQAAHLLSPAAAQRLTGIQFGGFGLTIKPTERLTTWRAELTSLVQELNDQEIGLLITIDEISASNQAVKTVVDVYQHFIREGRNVALLMAGLPQHVSLLLQDESISFLRRAFQRHLGSISVADVSNSLKITVENCGRSISTEALLLAANETKGFAYMIQLIGYQAWEQHPHAHEITQEDVEIGIRLARAELERNVFLPTIRGLSKRERDYLYALAKQGLPAKNATIAKELAISNNNAGNLRRRLMEQGIIEDDALGKIRFQIPYFADFLLTLDF